jgi:hypothetical protein
MHPVVRFEVFSRERDQCSIAWMIERFDNGQAFGDVRIVLVDVETNRQIWGNTYKGKLDDIFDIQEQVESQIVEALELKLTFSEKVSLTKRQTVNAQAYDQYLRGQDFFYRLSRKGTERAIQLFEKAIELDPRYAAAYAGCSSAYGQMYQWFSRAR